MTKNEWENEYMELFDNISKVLVTIETDIGSNEQKYAGDEVRKFITILLAQTRQDTVREVIEKLPTVGDFFIGESDARAEEYREHVINQLREDYNIKDE